MPGAGGGLGPFCPVSLAASVRGEGTLSVSELLLTAAAGEGRRGVSRVGLGREEVGAAPSPTARPDSGQELRTHWPVTQHQTAQRFLSSAPVALCCPGITVGVLMGSGIRGSGLGGARRQHHARCAPACLPQGLVHSRCTGVQTKDTGAPAPGLKKPLLLLHWVSIPPIVCDGGTLKRPPHLLGELKPGERDKDARGHR